MKIATFNVNSIRGRLTGLLDWLGEAQPDVVCLQELRIYDEEFPVAAIRDAGYGALWRGQKPRFNGVAIFARGTEPIDHLLLNSQLAKRLIDAGVDKPVRGRPGASDHAPTWIEVSMGNQLPRRR